jgi:hypothetical protein
MSHQSRMTPNSWEPDREPTEAEIRDALRRFRPFSRRRQAARAAVELATSTRLAAQSKLKQDTASAVQTSWPRDRDQLEYLLWLPLSEYANVVFDKIAAVRIQTLVSKFSLRRYSHWLRHTAIAAVVEEDVCPPGGQFYAAIEHVLGVLGDSKWPKFIDETKRALHLMSTEFLGGQYSGNLEKRLRVHLEGRIPKWEAEAIDKTSSLQPTVGMGSENSSSTAKPATRRGYRPEVREWMRAKKLKTVPLAAKRLGVSVGTLKSIMSAKGKKRYGNEKLTYVLKQIGMD